MNLRLMLLSIIILNVNTANCADFQASPNDMPTTALIAEVSKIKASYKEIACFAVLVAAVTYYLHTRITQQVKTTETANTSEDLTLIDESVRL